MFRNLLIALILTESTLPARADNAFWDGRWSGRISTGANVSIRIAGGKVSEYLFNGRPGKVAYASVSSERVSFSPGSAAVITLTRTSPGQASYSFTHPQLGPATGVLAKGDTQARVATRVPHVWFGTWGHEGSWMLTASAGGLDYSYRGQSLPPSNVIANASVLKFDLDSEARMVLTMRPDGKVDYAYTTAGRTTRGTASRR